MLNRIIKQNEQWSLPFSKYPFKGTQIKPSLGIMTSSLLWSSQDLVYNSQWGKMS